MSSLIEGREADGKYLALDLPRIEAEGTADWRFINVDQLNVEAEVS